MNKGTGEGFTVASGTLAASDTTPYKDDATEIVPEGLIAH